MYTTDIFRLGFFIAATMSCCSPKNPIRVSEFSLIEASLTSKESVFADGLKRESVWIPIQINDFQSLST